MATLGSRSSSPPASPSFRVRRKSLARRAERFCCGIVTYFPLAFVYGLTTWAVWVETGIGLRALREEEDWRGLFIAGLAATIYLLADISYTIAVFTDPGSPMSSSAMGYSHLPTHETPDAASLTVKSTGTIRYCKKCRCKKPDRAHHCSTCKRCVLKMDHHCPWLATCLGLRNHKAFVLFLIYTSIFCWVCFISSAGWVYYNVLSDGKYMDTLMPINYVLLAVISGIIGLVLTGFTIWHIILVLRNQTTIECMERVRYLSPLRKSFQNQQQQQYQNQQNFINGNPHAAPNYAQQLMDIHANILPGVTRPEEGEERPSPSSEPNIQTHTSYNDLERARERDRYDAYLDEQVAEKLPNAFDLGWKKNFRHLFGPNPLLWALPICNSTGDGWRWEPSPKWLEARERLSREREGQWRQQEEREREAGWGGSPVEVETQREGSWGGETLRGREMDDEEDEGERYMSTSLGIASVRSGRRSPSKADQILGRHPGGFDADSMRGPAGGSDGGMSMRTLQHRGDYDEEEGGEFADAYEGSSGEEDADEQRPLRRKGNQAGWGRKKIVSADEESGLVALGARRKDRAEDEWREW